MSMFARRRSAEDTGDQKPDVEGARAELSRIRRQRTDVDDLVAALVNERHLNNFTANVTATFRGGRP